MKIMQNYNELGINNVDRLTKDVIEKVFVEGTTDGNYDVRPTWANGISAHTLYITQHVEEYDISKGEFPITSLRRIPWKSGIKEILWIYQDQSNELSTLKEKHDIHWWDNWNVGDGTIGQRYGHTVKRYSQMNKLLNGIINSPMSRRHIMCLWQGEEFLEDKKGLKPCAFLTEWSVRDGYLDLTLVQRSSDYIMAGHINKIQYVALQMMVARHCKLKVGKFQPHVQNLHIYDRHVKAASLLVTRYKKHPNLPKPKLVLDDDATNFWDMTIDDFSIKNYEPLNPIVGLEIAE